MIETLYKTKTPEKGISECYVLVLTARPASERKLYLFMEEHGNWDDCSMQFIHKITSINTEGEMTYEEALGMYVMAKQRLAEQGFIHSFVPGHNHVKLHEHRAYEREPISA
jgi:hypothetical protein